MNAELQTLLDKRRHPIWNVVDGGKVLHTGLGVHSYIEKLNDPGGNRRIHLGSHSFHLYIYDGVNYHKPTRTFSDATFGLHITFQILNDWWCIGPHIFQLLHRPKFDEAGLLEILKRFGEGTVRADCELARVRL